jgi:hypothetical protein
VRKEQGVRLTKSAKVLGIYACINAVAEWRTVTANDMDDKLILSW